MILLADYNAEGDARLLYHSIRDGGWLAVCSLTLVTFRMIALPVESDDRLVWRTAQSNGMVLLTGNRNMTGRDSLEQTIREETRVDSLPILTIATMERVREREYRERCSMRLVEIALDLDTYRGAGRIFIP